MVDGSVDEHQRSHSWMNEDAPTFLRADPSGRKREERFRAHFSVDEGKLLVTADLNAKRPLGTLRRARGQLA
jgi:hypothetical protein